MGLHAPSLALAPKTRSPSKIALHFLGVSGVAETGRLDARPREPNTRGRGHRFPASLTRWDEPREGSVGREEHLVGVSPVTTPHRHLGHVGSCRARWTFPLKLGCELGVLPRGRPTRAKLNLPLHPLLQAHRSGTSGPASRWALLLDRWGVCWEGAPSSAHHGSRAVGG